MNSTNQTPKEVVFWEGRPIEKISEDQLGRKEFARFFAEAIARHNGRQSLVLSVNAPWGEGKTSFKNMMVDLLAQEQSERIVALDFTPWEWASQNQVSQAFFAEIAKQLELKDKSQNAKEAASRFRKLGQYLGLTGKIATPAGMLLEPVLPGSTIVTFALGKGLKKAYEISQHAADELQKEAEQEKQSLPHVKSELRLALESYLREQRKLILVVIDDIDRLSPDEIRLMLQMVKVNADFPALVFLLLYDHEFVVASLKSIFGNASDRFLEKIVQFQTCLPVLVGDRLADHLADELRKFFTDRPAYAALFDIERYRLLWVAGISSYITNLRQCGRLISSYQFNLGAFRSDDAEVNPLDFLVLEVYRLFEPQFYRHIYANRDRLFPRAEEVMIWSLEKKDENNPWLRRLDEFLKDLPNPAGVALFKEVFLRRGCRLDQIFITDEDQKAAQQRRLCHSLYFPRYFRLTIDAGDISDARITKLVNAFDEPDKFKALLTDLSHEGNLTLALTKLLARSDLKSSTKPREMIRTLCDFGDQLAAVPTNDDLLDPLDALRKLLELQVDASLQSAERAALFISGIKMSGGVHLPVLSARAQDNAEHAYSKADTYERANFGPHLDRADVAKLNDIAAERLEKAAQTDVLRLTPAWVRSIGWYLRYMRERTKTNPSILLTKPDGIALALITVIDDEAVKEYSFGRRSEEFARNPMWLAKNCFGFEAMDAAINANESELRRIDSSVAKRMDIYRDMRQHFSHLADPPPKIPLDQLKQELGDEKL